LKVKELEKKKTGYTLLEVIEIYDEIQRIKRDPQKYKFKNNLASRALWAKVEAVGNITMRSGESLRNFFKTWKSKTIVECIRALKVKKIRYSHAFKFPRYPFTSIEIDQQEPESPKKKPGKPGRPSKKRLH
jgi:hypothetical protein